VVEEKKGEAREKQYSVISEEKEIEAISKVSKNVILIPPQFGG